MSFHSNTKQRGGPWPGVGMLLGLNATHHIQSFSSESGPKEASENSLQPSPGGGRPSPRDMAASSALPAPHREASGFFYRAVSGASLWLAAGSHGVLTALPDSAVWMPGAAGRDGSQARNPALCAQPSLHCRGEMLPALNLKL